MEKVIKEVFDEAEKLIKTLYNQRKIREGLVSVKNTTVSVILRELETLKNQEIDKMMKIKEMKL